MAITSFEDLPPDLVASVFKKFLMELPSHIVGENETRIITDTYMKEGIAGLKSKINELSIENLTMFKYLIKLLNKILDNDSQNELKSLQSIDTDPYFVIDEETKKRCFKPQSLFNALNSKIDAIKERKIYTNSKSDKSLESQYQKLALKNGIEVYAVYTPLANQQLSHKILKTEISFPFCYIMYVFRCSLLYLRVRNVFKLFFYKLFNLFSRVS